MVKNIFGLYLLSKKDDENCVIEHFVPIIPEHEKCNPFLEYLTENYENSEAKYHISMWAVSNFGGTTKSYKVSISSKIHNLIHTDDI